MVFRWGVEWDTRNQGRCPKCKPQRAEFGDRGGDSFRFSEPRRTRDTGRIASLEAGMGPPQGECKPSSALPGKGHFILTSGDRGIRNRTDGKGEGLPSGPNAPNSTARQEEGTCWPAFPGEVTRVRGYNLRTDVCHQDQQNPGLALDLKSHLRGWTILWSSNAILAHELRNAER